MGSMPLKFGILRINYQKRDMAFGVLRGDKLTLLGAVSVGFGEGTCASAGGVLNLRHITEI